ncbi:uncharacterized protein BJ212DRAFT_1039038 [Suillus subaureus]|uniref:Secreted protein n=1 Tax=Suillus subaureus TaxID=48587 RepID=A0A9P7JFW8_9AGAM|nr:uncharacterized protein BJ212DRAFT_1039038 [Suillus subaureus]KAG1820590.1 hypothetical protein BJ212DRAFT_1039038 [Suillus subaureus]
MVDLRSFLTMFSLRSALVQCAPAGRICALSICHGGIHMCTTRCTPAIRAINQVEIPSCGVSFVHVFQIPLVLRHHPYCAHFATAPWLRLPSRARSIFHSAAYADTCLLQIEHGSALCNAHAHVVCKTRFFGQELRRASMSNSVTVFHLFPCWLP